MAKGIGSQTSWTGGIADDAKIGIRNSVAFLRGIDHRTSPSELRLTPKAIIDSGSTVTSLVMWGERACDALWFYDQSGAIYKRTTDGTWSKQHTASESSGNGLKYFGEDGNLYYAQNTTIGRLTRACEGDGKFVDDFLGVDGGEPTNTKSLQLVRTSSQYADIVDNANLSITGDLTLEIYAKMATLPTDTDEYVLMSKWSEQSDQRSYRAYITTGTSVFGDGSDGPLTISVDTTEAPIDANCDGTEGQTTLTISNTTGTFLAGQEIFIHQTRGTNAGAFMRNKITSVSGSTLNLEKQLTFSPAHSTTTTVANKAQVRVLKQHTTVTINSGVTYTAKAWDGLKGGIIGWLANDSTTINGTLTASEKGFRGGRTGYQNTGSTPHQGETGESYIGGNDLGASQSVVVYANNVTGKAGGGGGSRGFDGASGGGGGSYGTTGNQGGRKLSSPSFPGGDAAPIYGDDNLAQLHLGAGGGGGGKGKDGSADVRGGNGGGIIFVYSADFDNLGSITNNGENGDNGWGAGELAVEVDRGGAGGGAGGSTLIASLTPVMGVSGVSSVGGNGGLGARDRGTSERSGDGGAGGKGRISVLYLNSFSGSGNPTINFIQDDTLNNTTGYSLVFQVSNDGAAYDTFTWDITGTANTTNWYRYQITWEDSTGTAEAFVNANSLGSKTGSVTSIYDSTANFALGADYDSSGNAQNFFDGLIDDARLWNDIRTDSELASKLNKVLSGADANLIAYYEFEDDVTDSQLNITANDLTANNSPTYSEDVPFSGLTSRNDNDPDAQDTTPTGQTYTVPTAIVENGTGGNGRQDFIPSKEPLKSLTLNVNAVGTGDWTIKVHDVQNREVATVTVPNEALSTGFYEFTFDNSFRPTIGGTYHFHVTSTVADGTIVTSTTDDLNTSYYIMHYQFLVDDIYHPIAQILNKLAFGNGRYLATLEGGDVYTNDALILPSGYRIRALSYWREYLAIGVWRTATTNPSITDYDEGYIFFWDGTKDTYNYFITVPEGGINALYGSGNILYGIAGYSGDIIAYTGGDKAQKVKKIPKLALEKYLEVAPGSMTMWKTLLRMGVNLETDSEDVQKGVYSFGTLNVNYPHSLGFEHPLSLGENTSSTTKIGMVFPAGQDLYIGWQSGNAYGVDRVSNSNEPYETGTAEMLVTDLGQISRDKNPITLRADFEPLEEGQSITVKYKAKRETNWNYSTVEDTLNAREIRIPVIKELSNEIQVGVDLGATDGAASPVLTGLTLQTELEEKNRAI